MGVARGVPFPASGLPEPPEARIFRSMQPRFKHFWVVFLGVVVVAVIVSAVMVYSESFRRDPVCNGIRLSEILRDQGIWMADNTHPRIQQEYFHALCGMGRDAWPILLSELQTRDSKLETRGTPGIQRFIPFRYVPSDERRNRAWAAIFELILPPDERFNTPEGSLVWDHRWLGIKEFAPWFRRRIVTELADVVRFHLDDLELAGATCELLHFVGSDGLYAVPALDQAARAGVPGATTALARVRERAGEAPF